MTSQYLSSSLVDFILEVQGLSPSSVQGIPRVEWFLFAYGMRLQFRVMNKQFAVKFEFAVNLRVITYQGYLLVSPISVRIVP